MNIHTFIEHPTENRRHHKVVTSSLSESLSSTFSLLLCHVGFPFMTKFCSSKSILKCPPNTYCKALNLWVDSWVERLR